MNVLTTLGLAVGLALDAFAVAIVVGAILPKITARHIFRLAFHFGLFQFLMPVVGYLAGEQIATFASAWDHWIAFVLLAFVGGRMIWSSGQDESLAAGQDPTRGLTLVFLSLATSLDALAVGLTLGLLRISPWQPALVIGIVAAAFTTCGLTLGKKAGQRLGHWSEFVGGVVLIVIGVRILLSHLLDTGGIGI